MRLIGRWLILLIGVGHYAPAQDAAGKGSADLSRILQQGQALTSSNRLAEAEVQLTKAAAIAGDDDQILTLLAEVKSRLGEYAEAVLLFRKVSAAQPQVAQAHLNLAIALADSGQTEEALRESREAIRVGPRNARAHLNRARLLADIKRPLEARMEFLRAEKLAPTDPEIDYWWGVFEKEDHRPGAAASLLTKVVARQPDQVRALFLLGQMQQLLGRQQEAIVSWRRAIAVNPSMEEAVYALSQALRQTSPTEAAILMQQFENLHSQRQSTERVRELGNEAYAAMQQQKWDPAVTLLNEAIELCATCPLQADLHQRLGLAECHRGNLESGEHELRLALSLNPNDLETLHAIEWVADQKINRAYHLIP